MAPSSGFPQIPYAENDHSLCDTSMILARYLSRQPPQKSPNCPHHEKKILIPLLVDEEWSSTLCEDERPRQRSKDEQFRDQMGLTIY